MEFENSEFEKSKLENSKFENLELKIEMGWGPVQLFWDLHM